jgi:hypothetical protein
MVHNLPRQTTLDLVSMAFSLLVSAGPLKFVAFGFVEEWRQNVGPGIEFWAGVGQLS